MNGTRDIDDAVTADPDVGMDPREAARLLDETTRRAQHRFALTSPQLSVIGATVAVVCFGTLWLSVRAQHPYKGPTAAALVVLYGILACWIATSVAFRRRALSGVSGRSIRQERAFGAAVVVGLVAVSVYQGVLRSEGVSYAIVYGTYPPTAQLIVLGAVAAAFQGSREDWPGFGLAIAIMLVAAGSAFAGPRGVWLSDGIGIAVVVLAYGAVQAWLQRR